MDVKSRHWLSLHTIGIAWNNCRNLWYQCSLGAPP